MRRKQAALWSGQGEHKRHMRHESHREQREWKENRQERARREVYSSKQAINHSINQAETRDTGRRCTTTAGRGRERESERQTHTHGAHTNDKHAQGDEIKILGGRLVIVGRDTRLRGRLGRHDGGGWVWTEARNASWNWTWTWVGVCACARVHAQCNARLMVFRRVVVVAVYDELA